MGSRCLRQLETFPTNPSLVMSHPLCQSAAKLWVMTREIRSGLNVEVSLTDAVFDRMFQPKMVFSPLNPGTEKVSSIPRGSPIPLTSLSTGCGSR